MRTTEELQEAIDNGIPLITDPDVEPCVRVEVLDPVTLKAHAVIFVCPGDTISVTGKDDAR